MWHVWGTKEIHTGIWLGDPLEWDHMKTRTRDDIIKMDIQEVRWGGTDWIDLAEIRHNWGVHAKEVINLRVSKNAGNPLTSWGRVSFPGRTLLHGVSYYAATWESSLLVWFENGIYHKGLLGFRFFRDTLLYRRVSFFHSFWMNVSSSSVVASFKKCVKHWKIRRSVGADAEVSRVRVK